jgi:nickel-dependent lactate racemase
MVQSCLNWVARSHSVAAQARKGMEPEPFQKTEAYSEIEHIAKGISDAHFLTAVPRGGKLRAVLEDAPFDAIKNSFVKTPVQQTRGMIVGAGGRGFDDTLSAAIRGIWNVLPGLRRTGSVLLIAECSEGFGSTALEMLVTGRLSGEGERKREKYVEGLEEVFYLSKLKEEYDVMLLSGMPETYAGSKLGLTTARGSGEAVGRMLNKVGRSGKLNVVPRAPECLVEST